MVDNLSHRLSIQTFEIEVVVDTLILSDHPILSACLADGSIQPPLLATMILNPFKIIKKSLVQPIWITHADNG